jgi:hypothetical protein
MKPPYTVYLVVGTGPTLQPSYLDAYGQFVRGLANAKQFTTEQEAAAALAKCERFHNAKIQPRRVRP